MKRTFILLILLVVLLSIGVGSGQLQLPLSLRNIGNYFPKNQNNQKLILKLNFQNY